MIFLSTLDFSWKDLSVLLKQRPRFYTPSSCISTEDTQILDAKIGNIIQFKRNLNVYLYTIQPWIITQFSLEPEEEFSSFDNSYFQYSQFDIIRAFECYHCWKDLEDRVKMDDDCNPIIQNPVFTGVSRLPFFNKHLPCGRITKKPFWWD